ncbi:hypothetical protein RUM44_011138 [Polyplax serrata]|uniref:Uncharacterized protein n=1 Tax=Polyplax serrata TaxID=468196 RepID=A0ABR1AP70_POLSC
MSRSDDEDDDDDDDELIESFMEVVHSGIHERRRVKFREAIQNTKTNQRTHKWQETWEEVDCVPWQERKHA